MSFSDLKGASTVRTSKEAFSPLEERINREFEDDEYELEKSRIADIALAVGLVEEELKEVSGPVFTMNFGSIDKHDVMKAIIEERHPDKNGEELRAVFQRYLEGGAQLIAQEMDGSGVFKYHRYLSD